MHCLYIPMVGLKVLLEMHGAYAKACLQLAHIFLRIFLSSRADFQLFWESVQLTQLTQEMDRT
jgi:hypothetical protein